MIASLLLGACSYNGILGFEIKITPDLVDVRPASEQVNESVDCLSWRAEKNWC